MFKKLLLVISTFALISGCSSLYDPGKAQFNEVNQSVEFNNFAFKIIDPDFKLISNTTKQDRMHYTEGHGSTQYTLQTYIFASNTTSEALFINILTMNNRSYFTPKNDVSLAHRLHKEDSFPIGDKIVYRIEKELEDAIYLIPSENVQISATRVTTPGGEKRSIDDAIQIIEM